MRANRLKSAKHSHNGYAFRAELKMHERFEYGKAPTEINGRTHFNCKTEGVSRSNSDLCDFSCAQSNVL